MLETALLDVAVDSLVWTWALAIVRGETLAHGADDHSHAERAPAVSVARAPRGSPPRAELVLDDDEFARVADAVEQKLREKRDPSSSFIALADREEKRRERQDSFATLADRVERLVLEKRRRENQSRTIA